MRNPWQGDGSRRGRRPDRSGPVPSGEVSNSPYDFGAPDSENVDPVDLLAIRADDELLDALASGRPSYGGGYDNRFDAQLGTDLTGGYHDDQQMLAMLGAWRSEVLDEPIPELVSVEQASEAIVAGHHTRHGRSRRRLMPVAAAAAVVVLGLSGVAFGAGTAKPGDALWGVSKSLDGERAASVEAAERVSIALASAREALADGRVSEAQAVLASVEPELAKITDEETKDELARRSANLAESAGDAEEGEEVSTDESGKRDRDRDSGGKDRDEDSGESKSSDPGSDDPRSGDSKDRDQSDKGGAEPSPSPDSSDPRRATAPSEEPKPKPDGSSTSPSPKPKPSPSPSPQPQPEKPKEEGGSTGEGEGEPAGEGEGAPAERPADGAGTTTPPPAQTAQTPPGPQTPQPSS